MSLSGLAFGAVLFAPAVVLGAALAVAPQSGHKADKKVTLANEIVAGKRSVDDARKFYAESVARMMRDGKPTEYMQGFRFTTPSGNQGDADKPAGPMATSGR